MAVSGACCSSFAQLCERTSRTVLHDWSPGDHLTNASCGYAASEMSVAMWEGSLAPWPARGRVGVGVVEDVERSLAGVDGQLERFVGLGVVDLYRHMAVALMPQQADVDPVAGTAG
jgi:hypothetical protein